MNEFRKLMESLDSIPEGTSSYKVFIPGYMFSQNHMSNEVFRKSPIFQQGTEVKRPGDGMYMDISGVSQDEITAEIKRIFPSGFMPRYAGSNVDWKVEPGTFGQE